MSKFIVVQFNDYNTIENCYEFFSENAAAKYALYYQLQDADFSNEEIEEYQEFIAFIKNQDFIAAYEWFKDYYWLIANEQVYYYKIEEPENKELVFTDCDFFKDTEIYNERINY